MALQAPNTRLGQPGQPGLEERIRQLMAQRQPLPEAERRGNGPFVPGRDNLDDPTQRIVRTAQPDQPPTADEIIQEDSPRTLGGVVGAFEPSPAGPSPIPATAAERIVELRNNARRQAEALRSRVKPGPGMMVDGEPEPDISLPDPNLEGNFTPKPIEMNRTPKPGATQTGGYYVAPGRADAGGRALGAQQKADREKKEKADAEKAKNEADLAAEDAELDASGMVDEQGRPIRSKISDRHRNTSGADIDGLGDVVYEEARPGTGYRARKPGQERRLGANEQEQDIPMTDRRLPDAAGDRPPMLPGKGQSVVRDGGMSPRAPQQSIIDSIPPELRTSQPPKDQGQFFKWREAMKALAMAAGVNIAAFENEEDLVRAGASIAKQNERMNAPVAGAPAGEGGAVPPKYERTITSTGAPVFTPSDAMRNQTDDARRRASARQFVDQHKPDEQTGLAIMNAADKGEWETVDSLVRGARNQRRAGAAQTAMDQSRLRGQNQQMNNPNINRAMFHNSVMQQPNAAGVAQVATGWGAAGGIPAMISAEAVAADKDRRDADREVEREVGLANADAREKDAPPDPADYLAKANADAAAEIEAGVDENWNTARGRLRLKYKQAGRPEEEATYHVAGIVAAKGLLNHPAVVEALQTLYSKLFPGGVTDAAGALADGTMRQDWQTRSARFLAQTRAMNIPDDRAQQFLSEQK